MNPNDILEMKYFYIKSQGFTIDTRMISTVNLIKGIKACQYPTMIQAIDAAIIMINQNNTTMHPYYRE